MRSSARASERPDAHGVQLGDPALVHRQDDVDVVDHQVENHVDVEAAPRKGAEPVHLDEARRHPQLRKGVERRVETLHVTDLEDALPLASQSHERSEERV